MNRRGFFGLGAKIVDAATLVAHLALDEVGEIKKFTGMVEKYNGEPGLVVKWNPPTLHPTECGLLSKGEQMNSPAHMHQVRDYFIYIDHLGNIWKIQPTMSYEGAPFSVTLLHKA